MCELLVLSGKWIRFFHSLGLCPLSFVAFKRNRHTGRVLFLHSLETCFGADDQKKTLQTPLPPPPWTDNPWGIPLQTAPICKHCAEDLTVLEEAAPSTPPQTPPPPSPEAPFRTFPQWMAKLPSNRARKTAPSSPSPTHMPHPSPPTEHLSPDPCVLPHSESSSSEGVLLTHSLSTNIHAKALLGHKASSAAITRRKSLHRKYGDRAPPYMRELSAVFSDHHRKEEARSRTDKKRRSDEGERGGEEIISTDGHGWEDGGGRVLSLDKEEGQGSEERLCLWQVG